MPLPQFLRYRLAKRGILPTTEDLGPVEKPAAAPLAAPASPTAAPEAPQPAAASLGEEVIAEDYDSNPKKSASPTKNGSPEESDADNLLNEMQLKLWGHPGCPNKYNIYHECSLFCKERWGAGHIEMDPKYLKLRQKMLLKYPLPLNWVEVYDPGTGRYYYWEYESDFVSWLPPGHPRAAISESAAFLRDALHQDQPEEEPDEDEDKRKSSESEEEDDEDEQDSADERQDRRKDDKGRKRYRDEDRRPEKSSADDRHKSKSWRKDSDDEDLVKEPRPKDRKRDKEKEDKDRKRDGIEKKPWKKAFDKTLDPMDPAAYSDTPRGSWSSGIERKNEAKTGADTTASGPLYQMRPYPSPGDVLRANSKSKHSHEKPAKARRDSSS